MLKVYDLWRQLTKKAAPKPASHSIFKGLLRAEDRRESRAPFSRGRRLDQLSFQVGLLRAKNRSDRLAAQRHFDSPLSLTIAAEAASEWLGICVTR